MYLETRQSHVTRTKQLTVLKIQHNNSVSLRRYFDIRAKNHFPLFYRSFERQIESKMYHAFKTKTLTVSLFLLFTFITSTQRSAELGN